MRSDDTGLDGDRTLRTALTRRRMLALSSAAVATGIAGCSSGGESTETSGGTATETTTGEIPSKGSPTETSSSETSAVATTSGGTSSNKTTSRETSVPAANLMDPVPAMGSGVLMKNANWNFKSSGYNSGPDRAMFDPLARTYLNGEFKKVILDKWDYNSDKKQVTLTLKDTWKWHDGMTVTGKDWYIGQEINRLSDPSGSKFESHELADKFTVKSTYKKEQNPTLVKLNIGGYQPLRTKRDVWGTWLEKFKNSSTDNERKTVLSKLTDYKISSKDFKENGLGNSTWGLEDWSTTQFTLKKFEQHPHADRVDFDTWLFHVGEGSARNQFIKNDKIDVGGGTFPERFKGSAPKDLGTVFKGLSPSAWKLTLNWQNEHIQKRGVRRAIAAALPFGQIGQFFGNGGVAKELQTGMGHAANKKWLGKDTMNKMIEYPTKADTEKAAEFLKSEGYSKSGGKWKSEDGKTLKLNFVGWTNSKWMQAEKVIVRALQNADMEIKRTVKESAQFISTVTDSLDFDIAPFTHATTINPLNAYNYTNSFQGGRLGKQRGAVQKWAKNGVKRSKFNNRTLKPTVPKKIGSLDANGNGRQIDIVNTYDKIATADSEKKTKELTRDLAWYWNFDVPDIDMIQIQLGMWGDSTHFKFPPKDDLVYQLPSWQARYVAMKEGKIKGRPKK